MITTTDGDENFIIQPNELRISFFTIVDSMSEKDRLKMLRMIMGEGSKGFTAKAREIVNSPGYDD